MNEKVKKFFKMLGFILAIVFTAGGAYFLGRSFRNANNDDLRRIREDIERERAAIKSERTELERERKQLESARDRIEREREINQSERDIIKRERELNDRLRKLLAELKRRQSD